MDTRTASAYLVGTILIGSCTQLPTQTASERQESLRPVLVGGSLKFAQVSAGFVHTCALTSDGAAWCWGSDDYAQLGSASTPRECGGRPCRRSPAPVEADLRFTSIASGWVHNCGIARDGYTYCWGGGAIEGQGYLGDGAVRRSATPVRVLADSAFVAVTLGDGHTCALTASGVAFCWGQNSRGQLGDGSTTDRATPVAVAGGLRFRTLAAGAYHTCGVTTTNAAYCWGDNRWGQLGTGAVGYSSVASIAASPTRVEGSGQFTDIAPGWEHTCAIRTDGVTLCWGRNDDAHQLGDDSDVTHRGTPFPIAGEHAFVTLSAGALSTCGRTTTGDVYCWGGNYYGGLGDGSVAERGVGHPVHTQGGPFSGVKIGQAHACAVALDRRLWCWGDQSAGQF